MRSTRKFTALLLVFVFLGLNFTVELAHRHEAPPSDLSVTQHSPASDEGAAPQNHKPGCIACFFSGTHVAPASKCFVFTPESDTFPAYLRESVFHSVTFPAAYYLRAPPQTL